MTYSKYEISTLITQDILKYFFQKMQERILKVMKDFKKPRNVNCSRVDVKLKRHVDLLRQIFVLLDPCGLCAPLKHLLSAYSMLVIPLDNTWIMKVE